MDGPKLRRRIGRPALIAMGIAILLVSSVIQAAATHGLATLAGSNFEIDNDANLKNDDHGSFIDWADLSHAPGGPEIRATDLATGQNDDSYKGGVKEDTQCPAETTGTIPNNKSDLLTFHVYEEEGDPGFLNLAWSRVSDPSGTTLMDFEFNQAGLDQACPQGPNVVRTAGDLLIEYAIDQGGARAEISGRFWTGSAWGASLDLDDGTDCDGGPCAVGTINQSVIPANESDGLGVKQPRTFGEAQIDLDLIFDEGVCTSFGTAMLKSRSSDAFTSQLKDFIRPRGIDVGNCGSVKIVKKDDTGAALAGAEFTLYKDNAPVGGTRGAEDTITAPVQKCTTDANGECTIQNVIAGDYWVVETVTPDGHDTADDQTVTVVADETVTLQFVDPRQRGAILVTKTRKHAADGPGDHPHAGVDFTVNGVTKATDASGKACFDNLLPGDYTVHETTPTGYVGEADKTVTVDNQASCTDTPYGGETVSFSNTPLTNLSVTIDSQVPGGTDSSVACVADGPNGETPASGDGTFSDTNLVPGTYTCTVVIDP